MVNDGTPRTRTTAEYRAMRGTATQKPAKRDRADPAPMKRTAIGAKRRAMVQTELGFYPVFEGLLRLHGCDYWHCVTAQTSQPGWPDYAIFGYGWHAFVELKATSIATGRHGKLSADQERWRDTIRDAGAEYHMFLLPGDWPLIEDWLNGHTGKDIKGTWRTA
jgi:hypothetical protein